MKSKNIYDTLFDVYESSIKEDVCQSQIEFENDIDSLLSDDYELCKKTIRKLHSLLSEVGKEYYIAGIKTALELFSS